MLAVFNQIDSPLGQTGAVPPGDCGSRAQLSGWRSAGCGDEMMRVIDFRLMSLPTARQRGKTYLHD